MLEQPSERSKECSKYYVSIRSFTPHQTHDSVNYNCAQKVFSILERNEEVVSKHDTELQQVRTLALLGSEIINLRWFLTHKFHLLSRYALTRNIICLFCNLLKVKNTSFVLFIALPCLLSCAPSEPDAYFNYR